MSEFIVTGKIRRISEATPTGAAPEQGSVAASLPADVLLPLLSHLDARDLHVSGCINQHWRAVAHEPKLWTPLAKSLGLPAGAACQSREAVLGAVKAERNMRVGKVAGCWAIYGSGLDFAGQLAFGPDGSRLAIAYNGSFAIVDTNTGERTANFTTYRAGRLEKFLFCERGKRIAVVFGASQQEGRHPEEREIWLSDITRCNGYLIRFSHPGAITHFLASDESRRLVVASCEATTLTCTKTGDWIQSFGATHAAALSDNGSKLTLAAPHALSLYHTSDGSQIASLPFVGRLASLAFNRDASLLAADSRSDASGFEAPTLIIDTAQGDVLRRVPSSKFVTLGQDPDSYWHIENGHLQLTSLAGRGRQSSIPVPDGFNRASDAICSPDGKRLAIKGDKSVLLVGLDRPQRVIVELGFLDRNRISAMHFKRDSSRLLMRSTRDDYFVHDTKMGRHVGSFHARAPWLQARPAGFEFLCGLKDGYLRFREPHSETIIDPLEDPNVTNMAFHPESYQMAVNFCGKTSIASFC